MSVFSDAPRLVRGAFVRIAQPPAVPMAVRFQFNPERITRRRTVTVRDAMKEAGAEMRRAAGTPGEGQTTSTAPESISFDVRLDATDAVAAGDAVAQRLGVLPALSMLELMAMPATDSAIIELLRSGGFHSAAQRRTPVVIFVWNVERSVPVRITQLEVQELEYNAQLNPTRVIAGVTLEVASDDTTISRAMDARREALAASYLASLGSTVSILGMVP